MKVYSIGREAGCDIVIHDSTDVISRRHAVLTVMPSGKMTITDQSHNGTYVNGIRISPNVVVPVTRKDNVSLAHVAQLDWNRVPKQTTPMQIAIYALIAIIAIAGAWFGFTQLSNSGDNKKETTELATDSIKKQKEDSVKKAAEKDVKKAPESRKKAEKKKVDKKPVQKTKEQKPSDGANASNKGKSKTENKDKTTTRGDR